MVRVEVIYCPQDQPVFHQCLMIQTGSTVQDVLLQSSLFNQYPEAQSLAVGIFSKWVERNTIVHSGDRIEVLRPLRVDPKENRRQRAKSRKSF